MSMLHSTASEQFPGDTPVFEKKGICHKCVHYRPESLSCNAFPDGVPAEVLVGDFIHTRPYEGDHGIRFEPTRSST